MKHNIILYIILLIVLIFLIIYKNKILEGLNPPPTHYLPNLTKKNLSTGTIFQWKKKTECQDLCPISTCTGFISVPMNSNTNIKDTCITFPKNDLDLNINNLRNLKHDSDSFLYINKI